MHLQLAMAGQGWACSLLNAICIEPYCVLTQAKLIHLEAGGVQSPDGNFPLGRRVPLSCERLA